MRGLTTGSQRHLHLQYACLQGEGREERGGGRRRGGGGERGRKGRRGREERREDREGGRREREEKGRLYVQGLKSRA